METKDTTIEVKRLSQDVEYYNNVFKKTEKIASVIFYILSFKKDDLQDSVLYKSLEQKSFTIHELSLNTLQSVYGDVREVAELQQGLVSLMSTLQVATAARVVTEDMTSVIIEQIDAVQRYIANHYLSTKGMAVDDLYQRTVDDSKSKQGAALPATKSRPPQKRQQRVAVPGNDISSDAYLVYSQLNDRSERIKTVLEAKPQATVKDIAEIITDVSEKTIQRDLNSLIEKGQVEREGERRWSRYSVIKD